MILYPGLAMLSISASVMGRSDTVHPVLLWDGPEAVLIDTGFPRQSAQLAEAIRTYGVEPHRLTRLILTHQDIDHIGNVQEVAETASTRLEVTAHELEAPYIQGDRRLIRFTDEALAGLDLLPDQVPAAFREGLRALMLHPPRTAVHRTVQGGELLPWCGGLTVAATPGHTPGHISLYHGPSRTLIAGDALTVREGRLFGPDPATTLDRETARASLEELSAYDTETVVCYHGGWFRGRIRERLAELAAEA
ncbi:MBL fold metallo-hydrolase [Gorillibacterium sp. sgz5001074]|uniref:MBL fold metallo-hydrolase n=1 Tax=Gorillibacterium sp. sgz5001074 TaxID=3446695 RepID=UPI003F667349